MATPSTCRSTARTRRVRLIGIDTPETKKPDTPIECFGPEATAFTTSLLPPGTALHLERDVVARDDYGRLLAYVYRGDDGTFVNLRDHRAGLRPSADHRTERRPRRRVRRRRHAIAEADDIGLWAGCTG